jgi:hypothetical protein
VQTQEQKRMADAQEEEMEKEDANDEPDGGEETPKISAVADTTDEEPQAPAEDETAEKAADDPAEAEPPATEPAES